VQDMEQVANMQTKVPAGHRRRPAKQADLTMLQLGSVAGSD
jgi:hypothetical protein